MKVKVRKLASHGARYKNYVITLPKELIQKYPRLKRAKFVEIEDVLGNIVLKF